MVCYYLNYLKGADEFSVIITSCSCCHEEDDVIRRRNYSNKKIMSLCITNFSEHKHP